MLSPSANTVAWGYPSSSSAVASSFVRSQRAMSPAPISWTARGEGGTARGRNGTSEGGGGGRATEVGLRSSVHVTSNNRAPARPTVTTSFRKLDFIILSQVGRTPLPARRSLDWQGKCHRGTR